MVWNQGQVQGEKGACHSEFFGNASESAHRSVSAVPPEMHAVSRHWYQAAVSSLQVAYSGKIPFIFNSLPFLLISWSTCGECETTLRSVILHAQQALQPIGANKLKWKREGIFPEYAPQFSELFYLFIRYLQR